MDTDDTITGDCRRALEFDLKRLAPSFLADPFPIYRALREHDPVHRMPDGSYFLSRYEDCAAVYRDPETWSSDKRRDFRPNFADSLLYEHHTTSLVFNDPPYHTRVRKLLSPAFTPRALAALQPRIEALVDRLIDRAVERGGIDLIEDFAAAIPVQLIGDMLGVPQDERGPLRGWSLAILGALEPVLSPEQSERGIRAVADFKTYLRDLVARRAGEGRRDDGEILSTLIAASDCAPGKAVMAGHSRSKNGVAALAYDPAVQVLATKQDADARPKAGHDGGGASNGDRLSELELLHNCIFILNAGHETTTNLIGNGIDLLIRFPHAQAELRRDASLIASAVEEFLRMESSNQLGNRRALRDTAIGGVAMREGTYVHIGIGAANRDPAQFADPDRLDIARRPNRHLAFGTGIHACSGMSLARMEGQVAIGRLMARADIAPAGEPVRSGRARFRGFLRYPVRVRARV